MMEDQTAGIKFPEKASPYLDEDVDKIEKARQIAYEVINDLLEKMNVDAKVVTRIVDPENLKR